MRSPRGCKSVAIRRKRATRGGALEQERGERQETPSGKISHNCMQGLALESLFRKSRERTRIFASPSEQ